MGNRTLSDAIKEVFSQLGIEAMHSIQFVNAINDYGGFYQFPHAKVIITDLIKFGDSKLIYELYKETKPSLIKRLFVRDSGKSEFLIRLNQLSVSFYKKTNYSIDEVIYVYNSIAVALGYCKKCDDTMPEVISDNIANLQETDSQTVFKATVIAQSDETEIWIDGRRIGYGKVQVELVKGIHIFTSKSIGSYDKDEKILVYQNQQQIELSKLSIVGGTLVIDVLPYGSDVYIDYTLKGTTPLTLTSLSPRLYKVSVETSDGGKIYKDVTIQENRTTEIKESIPSIYMMDYKLTRPGDYFYEDGTFLRIFKSKTKRCIGRVVTLETSRTAKEQGFSHGQILLEARKNVSLFKSLFEKTLFPKYSKEQMLDLVKNWKGLSVSGFDICLNPSLYNNSNYPAISRAKEIGLYNFASRPYVPSIEDVLSSAVCLLDAKPYKYCHSESIAIETNGRTALSPPIIGIQTCSAYNDKYIWELEKAGTFHFTTKAIEYYDAHSHVSYFVSF